MKSFGRSAIFWAMFQLQFSRDNNVTIPRERQHAHLLAVYSLLYWKSAGAE